MHFNIHRQKEHGHGLFPDTPFGLMPLIPSSVSATSQGIGPIFSTDGMDIRDRASFNLSADCIEPYDLAQAFEFTSGTQIFDIESTRITAAFATDTPLFSGLSLLSRWSIGPDSYGEEYQAVLVDAEEWGLDVHEDIRTATPSPASVLTATMTVSSGVISHATSYFTFPTVPMDMAVISSHSESTLVLHIPRYGVTGLRIQVQRKVH